MNVVDAIKKSVIVRHDGTRRVIVGDPLAGEKLLTSVMVLKYHDGRGEVRFPTTGECIFPYDLRGMTLGDVADAILKNEESRYGGPANG